jgi:hypothetical protein
VKGPFGELGVVTAKKISGGAHHTEAPFRARPSSSFSVIGSAGSGVHVKTDGDGWHEYPGEGREVLTTTSRLCCDGKHDDCGGLLRVKDVIAEPTPEQLRQKFVLCICACHMVPGTGN